MHANCRKCGARAEVSLSGNGGLQYQIGSKTLQLCEVIQDRMKAAGGSTSNMDCDNMLDAAQATARQMRGGR